MISADHPLRFGFLAVFLLSLPFHILAQDADQNTPVYQWVKVGYQHDLFDKALSDWNSGIVEAKFEKDSWSVLPRLTLTNRFDQFGWQLETDVYKKFKNKDYLYLDGGFSPDPIFPRAKLGAEYYNPFGGSWEHSVGVRWMNFHSGKNIGLITASLTKYYGKWLSSVRGIGAYGFDSNEFANYAVVLNQRYYFTDAKYLGLSGSYGYDPSLIVLIDNSGTTKGNPSQLSFAINFQSDFNQRRRWNAAYEWTRYDFVTSERIQHTIKLFFTLKRKGI